MGQKRVIEDFTVVLQSRPSTNGPIYVTGDTLKGHLNIEILQHIKLTTISITVKGQGYVHWTEQKLRGHGEPRFKDTHHHSASEEYFEHTLVLFGQGFEGRADMCILPAGQYTYPFQCNLPSNIPCSYEGELGWVRYWVKASIEKGREVIHKTKIPFTVLSPLELSSVPDSDTPVQESTEKSMCCWCCLSGPISASLCIPKRGFVPGEPIKFSVEVSNLSSRQMRCCSVELKMTTIFKTLTRCRSTTEQMCKVKRDRKFGRGESITWFCDQLVVPPVPPSCLIGCSLISTKYTLELRVDPVGPAFDLILPVEVIIGTLPHRAKTDLHHYANISYQPPFRYNEHCPEYRTDNNQQSDKSHNNINMQQKQNSSQQDISLANRQHNSDTEQRSVLKQPTRVPILPMQAQTFINAASSPTQSTQNVNQPTVQSSRDHGQPRPSSRASSVPSTVSTSSVRSIKAIFAEAAFGRRSLQFDSEYGGKRVKFVPLYPYYIWR